jgi:glycosyltransferase involved in cell wall biosynthesis
MAGQAEFRNQGYTERREATSCALFLQFVFGRRLLVMASSITERRYRVLSICSHPVQYMAPLLRRLAAHPQVELEVAYCTLRGAESGNDPEFGVAVKWDIPLLEGYSWTHVPNRGSGDRSFFGLNNPGLWKMIRQGKFDAVLCYTGYIRASFWIAWLAAKLSGAVFIFGTDTTTLVSMDGKKWKPYTKRLFWPFLYRLADQVNAPCSGTRELMHSLGIPDDRVTLIPNCVDNDWWIEQSSRVDREAVRTSWGASPDTSIILFCGKLQPWKRPLDLLHAFARAELGDALLIFAGEGPLRAALEKESISLGVADRVRFLGFVNQTQLPGIYTGADLLVLPSRYEAFGLVVNEALLCGCPAVVSNRTGSAKDLIAPTASEFVYPSGDVEALTAILRRAFSNRQALAAAAFAGRKRMETWGPRENIAGTVEAIERAVARREATQHPAVTEF